MAYEFLLPDIGEGLHEATVLQWFAKIGDHLDVDAPMVEVETDKAITEIPAPRAGVLLHQGAAVDEVIEVGRILAVIGEADAARLLEARRTLAEQRDTPVPVEALLIAAIVPVLREEPEFNAAFQDGHLLLRRYYDIGFAVDTPDGLMVAVVRGADGLGVMELADEIARLADRVRTRTADPAELRGATFTVSNIGAVGGGYGTPIIPHGTSAILSVGRAEAKPVVRDGQIVVATMLPMSLSYDHRVVDGAAGRRFIGLVATAVEGL